MKKLNHLCEQASPRLPLHSCSHRDRNGVGRWESNRLLQALLARHSGARLMPYLSSVTLKQGEVLLETGLPATYAYFPTTGTVSLSRILADGRSPELAAIGREGMIGISGMLSADSSGWRGIVASSGHAWRLPRELLRREFSNGGRCQSLLLQYVHALMMDISHGSLCNAHHVIQERLGRLLLHMLDHSDATELQATHEMLANRLGVRRESISEVASALQSDGMIRCRRGRIQVLDRQALSEVSCECYELIVAEYDAVYKDDVRQSQSRRPVAL